MREYLSYHLMQEMGIPSPCNAFVNLYINDELFGLYLAVEAVDDEFAESRFESGDGDLYKAEMGTDLIWKGDSIDKYPSLELKTNEDTSDHGALFAMLDELNNGSDYEAFIDVDEVLRYLAVSTALTNLDSYQGPMAQNYYLYEDNGVFSIIPWDFNMSFGGFDMGCDRTSIIEFMIDEPTSGRLEDRPLIARLLQYPDYLEIYHGYLSQLITGPFAPETMDQIIDETADLIREYVYADPTKFFTAEEFEHTLTNDLLADPNASVIFGFNQGFGLVIGLKAFVNERVASISGQLNGLAPASGDGSGNCDRGFGTDPNRDAIVIVSPSYAYQGDTNVMVTITLREDMQQMLPAEMNLLSVKIGSLEGNNIGRNGLDITAVFDIPVNETKGMHDVSVLFLDSDGQTIIFTKSDAFDIVAGNTDTPGNHYGWYMGNHYGWFNPLTPHSWFLPENLFEFGQKSGWSIPKNIFISELQDWYELFNLNWYKFEAQNRKDKYINRDNLSMKSCP